jgi:DNA-binding response OmpR family regulator
MARILIVEDEPRVARGLQDDLVLEGYDVEVAGDGIEAVRRAHEGAFDLIVLDVMLPAKDGFDVCRELRREGMRTPIIMLTAKTEESEKLVGFDVGADDYVTKPFSPRELRARIKAALRRGGETVPAQYRFGDVQVDLDRCELRVAGLLVDTSALELKLLAAFIRHRGHTLARAMLLDEVWGHGTFVTDRVVDTHVANLRKKIESHPASPRYLVSVRGMGYRFDG